MELLINSHFFGQGLKKCNLWFWTGTPTRTIFVRLFAYYDIINMDTALMSIEPTKVIYSEMRNSIYNN